METQLEKSKTQLQLKMRDMEEFQQSKNYLEADKCMKEVQKLKADISKYEELQFKKQQKKNMSEIVKMHQNQNETLAEKWKEINEELTSEIEDARKKFIQKQQDQMEESVNRFNEDYPSYNESSALLNLNKMEEKLAKQHNFNEAQKIKTQRTKLEAKEKQQHEKQKEEKKRQMIKKMKTKQEQQKQVFEGKIKIRMEEFNLNKQKEEKQMKLRHQNNLNEFKNEQSKENLYKQGKFTSRGGNNFGKLQTATRIVSPRIRNTKNHDYLRTK